MSSFIIENIRKVSNAKNITDPTPTIRPNDDITFGIDNIPAPAAAEKSVKKLVRMPPGVSIEKFRAKKPLLSWLVTA